LICSIFPNRTWNSIVKKANKLGLKRQKRKAIDIRGYCPSLDGYIIKDCYFCQTPITKLSGLDYDSLVIHHINHNHYDNRPENRAMAHNGCHTKHHQIGNHNFSKHKHTAKTKTIMSNKRYEFYKNNPGAIQGNKNPMFGRKRPDLAERNRSPEMRRKSSERMKLSNPMRCKI
jgi:hypothetical protein